MRQSPMSGRSHPNSSVLMSSERNLDQAQTEGRFEERNQCDLR